MADPTASEVDAIVTLVDADISTAVREMIRLLSSTAEGGLRETIARWNTRRNWTLHSYDRYGQAPKDLTGDSINQILFKVEEAPQELKGGNRYRTDATIYIYVIGKTLGSNSLDQISECRRVGGLIKAILAVKANNHSTPGGLPAWNQLTFGNLRDLPSDWRNYAGCTVPVQVMGWPGSNSWGVA